MLPALLGSLSFVLVVLLLHLWALSLLAVGSEKALLGDDDGTICLRKQLLVDGKKEQEPRVLVRGVG